MGESGRGQWGKVVEEKTLARLSALLKICKKMFLPHWQVTDFVFLQLTSISLK